MNPVLLLATLETKAEEAEYLQKALHGRDVEVEQVDISLGSGEEIWNHKRKVRCMAEVSDRVSSGINSFPDRASAVVGIGGGTGGELALRILRTLPFDLPKFLITTLPFDPRVAVADNSIVMIPTVADIEGLNSSLRMVLDNAAAMIAGLARSRGRSYSPVKSIGLSTLGATRIAARSIISRLRRAGHEVTTFHANGYGGAAFAKFAGEGVLAGAIDMTVHEITRMHVTGSHVAMPERFTAMGDLPRVVLPGGMNFLGLGEIDLVPPMYLERLHYQHSGFFTHVKLTPDEMETACAALAEDLNQTSSTTRVIIPMGGFSHEDRPGGSIEDKTLRMVAAECLESRARAYEVERIECHINDEETADMAVHMLLTALAEDRTGG